MKLSETGQPDNDKVLAKIEKKINKEYTIANKEMEKKLKNYMKKFEAKDKEKKKLVKSGQLSQEDYIKWRQDKIVVGKQWESMCQVLAEDLDNSRIIAQHIVSNDLPTVYANGLNYGTYEIEKTGINTNFTLYNHDAVEILVSENPKLYPDPTKGSETWQKLKSKEVQKWSKAKINSAVTQAILQGEAIDQIAKRLRKVTDMDYKASIRNARTMVGAAQNAGHQRSYERAENMGVKLVKVWVSTLDMRTRHTHAVMDGEAVPVKEKFSNGLLYPRDMINGTPAEVYNCRCRPIAQVKGFEKGAGSLVIGKQDKLNGMTYDEWKQYHQDALKKKATKKLTKTVEEVPEKYEVVNGENIFETWERREDEFAFEIEDIINAQGFDGLPRVVSAEEFEKAVQESKFIAQRTYSAESKEILDQYRNELYHGKWYVDCSVNGADRGQGMYCAANYEGKTKGLADEMKMYQKYNKDNYGYKHSYVETMTMTPNAKVADYREVFPKFQNQKREYWEENAKKYIEKEIKNVAPSKELEERLSELAKSRIGAGDKTVSEWEILHSSKSLDTREFNEQWGNFMSRLNEKAYGGDFEKGFREIKDFGSYCASKGYDAINAPGGQFADSYTVILNRTKLIIKEP